MPVPATAPLEGSLIEIFSSFQGEGLLVGCRQIFIRMAGCNLDCAYCDTPFQATEFCRVEDAPSSEIFRPLHNPVSLDTLLTILTDWDQRLPGLHHSIALTGGEPLLQASLLGEWLPSLRGILPIYLETNGTLPSALEPLLPHLDWISMDLKLPSVSGSPTPWQDHCNFLALAREKECQVKVVVGEETSVREVTAAARMVHEVAPQVPLILQPVTKEERIGLASALLVSLHTAAARIHPTTRIIPQTHRFLGIP